MFSDSPVQRYLDKIQERVYIGYYFLDQVNFMIIIVTVF